MYACSCILVRERKRGRKVTKRVYLSVCVYKTEKECDRRVEQEQLQEKKKSDGRDSFSIH